MLAKYPMPPLLLLIPLYLPPHCSILLFESSTAAQQSLKQLHFYLPPLPLLQVKTADGKEWPHFECQKEEMSYTLFLAKSLGLISAAADRSSPSAAPVIDPPFCDAAGGGGGLPVLCTFNCASAAEEVRLGFGFTREDDNSVGYCRQ